MLCASACVHASTAYIHMDIEHIEIPIIPKLKDQQPTRIDSNR